MKKSGKNRQFARIRGDSGQHRRILIIAALVGLIAFAYIMSNREKSAGDKSGAELYKAPKEGKKSDRIRGLFLGLALVLIVLGAANGGARDVLVKAINICTECIGLG